MHPMEGGGLERTRLIARPGSLCPSPGGASRGPGPGLGSPLRGAVPTLHSAVTGCCGRRGSPGSGVGIRAPAQHRGASPRAAKGSYILSKSYGKTAIHNIASGCRKTSALASNLQVQLPPVPPSPGTVRLSSPCESGGADIPVPLPLHLHRLPCPAHQPHSLAQGSSELNPGPGGRGWAVTGPCAHPPCSPHHLLRD